ncbi:MAG: prephenate dehydrogenase/arogenate dehydrogenase family protein [Desulfotalea sp.]
MSTIATLGPNFSSNHRAALCFKENADVKTYTHLESLREAFITNTADYIILPVFNTREGDNKAHRQLISEITGCSWVDNIILPINLSLGALDGNNKNFDTIVSTDSLFRQCGEYLNKHYPDATRMAVPDISLAITKIHSDKLHNYAVIEAEEFIRQQNLEIIIREIAPHNKTRFAVIGRKKKEKSGYDATAISTKPLRDRVGLLTDLLGEFTRRGINIIDLKSETDIETQKLAIYLEIEGHIDDINIQNALTNLEENIIQEERAFQLLGSFPRIDMRVKNIKSVGFIGSGAMSRWFADRLENEGYQTLVTGRSTVLTPEEMIAKVDVVMVCVPISATPETIKQYGPLLKTGQALVILAGESERTIATSMEATAEGVEILFVHNLWGPQARTMKDKNVSVVRTMRSGIFSDEIEAFLYKHGAAIQHDSEKRHDLLMGVSQKLPSIISVALAMTLNEHDINANDIDSHSTLTSIYGILAMARIHNQNHRTYAEIISTQGEGEKIVSSFMDNIAKVFQLSQNTKIDELSSIIQNSSQSMDKEFLDSKMKLAKAVDEILGTHRL